MGVLPPDHPPRPPAATTGGAPEPDPKGYQAYVSAQRQNFLILLKAERVAGAEMQ